MLLLHKKRLFILLEAIIALSIVALVCSLFFSEPIKCHKKNIETLYKVELARHSESLFFDLEQNFTKKIAFESLQKTSYFETNPATLTVFLDSKLKKDFNYHFRMSVEKEKTGPSSKHKLIKARLLFFEKKNHKPIECFERIFFVSEKTE